jgi:micrococcal nuclease
MGRLIWRAAACLLWLAGLWGGAGVAFGDEWATVKWVNDGDTVVLADGRRVRYIGINAPEIAHAPHDAPGEPYGIDALKYNRKLVTDKAVQLVYDRETRDQYGRWLAYVFLSDNTFVNLEMLAMGYAHVLWRHPNRAHENRFLQAQRRAMQAGKGIWRQWNETGGGYVGSRRSRRFHRPECPLAARIHPTNRVTFNRRWDAFWAGFAPAKGCKP